MKFLIIFFAYLNPVNQISSFSNVINLAYDSRYIYVVSSFGTAVLDGFTYEFKKGYILDKEISILAPDLYTGYVYYITSQGALYQYNLNSQFEIFLGFFSNVSSIGLNATTLFLDTGTIIKLDKFSGMKKGTGTEQGIVWFGERGNLSRNSREVMFLAPFFFYDENIGRVDYTVFMKQGGKILAGTSGDGIHIFSENTWIREKIVRIGPATPKINFIYKTTHEDIWVAGKNFKGYNGLSLKTGKNWEIFKKGATFGMEYDEVNTIIEAGEKIIFGVYEGILIYEKKEFHYLHLPKLSGRDIISLYYDMPNLWIGTDAGLYILDISSGIILQSFLGNYYIEDIEKFKGKIFIATDNGLYTISPLENEPVPFIDTKNWISFYISELFSTRDSLWIATPSGILATFKKGDKFEFFYTIPPPFSPKSSPPLDMKFYNGNLYAGTIDGLYIYVAEKDYWRKQTEPYNFENLPVHSLLFVKDTLWAGTERGIFLFKEDRRY